MKRWFFGTLFALALFVCPAFAAVETGGTEYLWTTEYGNTVYGEYDETTGEVPILGFQGQRFLISADGGASYAELPGLRERTEQVWCNYRMRVTPIENGGLRLEGWGEWETEVTWSRDYTAAELSAALKNAVPTPVRVRCTNGTITLATRKVSDNENDDPAYAGWDWESRPDRERTVSGQHLLWTTDGATWNDTGLIGYAPWYEDGAFYDDDYIKGTETSTDGVHWTKLDERKRSTKLRYACDLGKYHFEVVNAEDWQNGNDVYLMDQDHREEGVLLPDLGKAIRAMGIGVADIQAWYTPNDTVTVAVYDYYKYENYMYSLTYPISSLDWCLENLSKPFRGIETRAGNGEVWLGMTAESNVGNYRVEGSLLRNDGTGWKPVTGTPFGNTLEILPHNGKTFLIQDTAALKLYASEDGLTWVEVDALKPEGMEPDGLDYIHYGFAWTGKGYIAHRKAGVPRHGMMGMAGGQWYEGNTKVYFLNEGFQVTGSYDFGRLVEAVGYVNEMYYAQVTDSTGTRDGWEEDAYSGYEGSTLYRSADGKNWTALGSEYLDIEDILIRPEGGDRKGNFPTGDPNKPLRSVAQAGQWRFVLKGSGQAAYPCLVADGAWKYVGLVKLREKIDAGWITPGTLTAEPLSDGSVRLTVTDLYTPTMTCQHTYTAAELEAFKTIDGFDMRVNYHEPEEQVSGAGVDVGLMDRAGGEKELAYRTAETGKWLYLDQTPWSNSIVLLPYSGKDFFLLDKADGTLWRSQNGKDWTASTGEWAAQQRDYDAWYYAFVWTGEHYLATCALAGDGGLGRGWEQWPVLLLDEDLNPIGAHGLNGDSFVGVKQTGVGVRDGVCYADNGEAIYRSLDGGRTWEETDISWVRACLTGTKDV